MDIHEENFTDLIDKVTDTTPRTDQANEHHNDKGEPSRESGDSQVPPPDEQTEEQNDLPRLEEVFSTYVPTIIYVPKAARKDWSRLQSDELASTTTNISSVQQWVKLMMLTKGSLPASNILIIQ